MLNTLSWYTRPPLNAIFDTMKNSHNVRFAVTEIDPNRQIHYLNKTSSALTEFSPNKQFQNLHCLTTFGNFWKLAVANTYILTHSKQLCDAKFFLNTPFIFYPLFGLHATVSEKNWHPHWWTTEVTYWSNRGLKSIKGHHGTLPPLSWDIAPC